MNYEAYYAGTDFTFTVAAATNQAFFFCHYVFILYKIVKQTFE